MVNVIVRLKGSLMGGKINDGSLYSKERVVTGYDKEGCLHSGTQHDIRVI